jgi:hypothetical protein
VAGAAEILARAVTEAEFDVEEWWVLDDQLQDAAAAAPAAAAVVALLQERMLDSLAASLAINSDVTEEYTSHFSILLGKDFVPEDTGPDWILFHELFPGLRDRIRADTGFEIPGCRVRADRNHRDTLWVLLNGAPLGVYRLPTRGVVRRARAGEPASLVDPLTGDAVVDDPGASVEPGWTPLEFAMRHVERIAREHLGELVTVLSLYEVLRGVDGPAAASVTSDARAVMSALGRLRAEVTGATWADPEMPQRVLAAGLAALDRGGTPARAGVHPTEVAT